MTTIAWRMSHIAASNIGTRANAGFGDAQMLAPIGASGGPFADEPLAALVFHVSPRDDASRW